MMMMALTLTLPVERREARREDTLLTPLIPLHHMTHHHTLPLTAHPMEAVAMAAAVAMVAAAPTMEVVAVATAMDMDTEI